MPVYNVENYISTCVESLLNQTYPNFEIILIDDGSPDNCPAICDEYAAQHENVRVIHQENKGVAAARNAGLDAAKGDWLMYVDSDDFAEPGLLTKLYDLHIQTGADLVSSGIDTGKRIDGVFSAEEAIAFLLREKANMVTSPWGKLMKATLFDGVRFPEGIIFEDYVIVPVLFDRANTIAHTGEVLYRYRQDNTEGITHSKFSDKRMDFFTASDMVEAFLTEKYPQLLKYARDRRTRSAISFYKQLAQAGGSSATAKVLVKYTRTGILPYLFSSYRLTSKAYGLLITVCPPLALRLFQRK